MNAKQRRAKRRAARGVWGWVGIGGHRIYARIDGRTASDVAADIARQGRALGFNMWAEGTTIHTNVRRETFD